MGLGVTKTGEGALERRLHDGLIRGDFGGLAETYAENARLEASLPGGRVRLTGPRAIVSQFADWWPTPGRLVEWSARSHTEGVELWMERISEDASHDELVEDFRSVRGEHDDPRANRLIGLIGLVMYGWIFGHSAAYHPDPAEREWGRSELSWWVPQARSALEGL